MELQELPGDVSPPNAESMLESGSKVVALTLLVLYACGFLITSLHNSQYGYSEMNPFRPRILTAGAWFFIFLALPFTFVRRLTQTSAFKNPEGKGIVMRFLDISFVYLGSCQGVSLGCSYILSFDDASSPPWTRSELRIAVLIALGGLMVLILALFVFSLLSRRWRQIVVAAIVALLLGNIIYQGVEDFILKHQFRSGAVLVWLAATGLFFYYELQSRSWLLSLGDWPITMMVSLGFLAFFAKNYYPHILSSWGGGMPIPITVTFTKDAVKNASQDVSYRLLDETDTGLYVLPINENTAAFLPRSAVGMVRFAIRDTRKK